MNNDETPKQHINNDHSIVEIKGEDDIEPVIIKVPYLWKRKILETNGKVYYITPSGHVLISYEDVLAYLDEASSCKCFLDETLQFDEVFNFDSRVSQEQLTEFDTKQSPCEKWSRTFQNDQVFQSHLFMVINYLLTENVTDLVEMYKIYMQQHQFNLDDIFNKNDDESTTSLISLTNQELRPKTKGNEKSENNLPNHLECKNNDDIKVDDKDDGIDNFENESIEKSNNDNSNDMNNSSSAMDDNQTAKLKQDYQQWQSWFDWSLIIMSKNGLQLTKDLQIENLKHLAYEFKIAGMIYHPENEINQVHNNQTSNDNIRHESITTPQQQTICDIHNDTERGKLSPETLKDTKTISDKSKECPSFNSDGSFEKFAQKLNELKYSIFNNETMKTNDICDDEDKNKNNHYYHQEVKFQTFMDNDIDIILDPSYPNSSDEIIEMLHNHPCTSYLHKPITVYEIRNSCFFGANLASASNQNNQTRCFIPRIINNLILQAQSFRYISEYHQLIFEFGQDSLIPHLIIPLKLFDEHISNSHLSINWSKVTLEWLKENFESRFVKKVCWCGDFMDYIKNLIKNKKHIDNILNSYNQHSDSEDEDKEEKEMIHDTDRNIISNSNDITKSDEENSRSSNIFIDNPSNENHVTIKEINDDDKNKVEESHLIEKLDFKSETIKLIDQYGQSFKLKLTKPNNNHDKNGHDDQKYDLFNNLLSQQNSYASILLSMPTTKRMKNSNNENGTDELSPSSIILTSNNEPVPKLSTIEDIVGGCSSIPIEIIEDLDDQLDQEELYMNNQHIKLELDIDDSLSYEMAKDLSENFQQLTNISIGDEEPESPDIESELTDLSNSGPELNVIEVNSLSDNNGVSNQTPYFKSLKDEIETNKCSKDDLKSSLLPSCSYTFGNNINNSNDFYTKKQQSSYTLNISNVIEMENSNNSYDRSIMIMGKSFHQQPNGGENNISSCENYELDFEDNENSIIYNNVGINEDEDNISSCDDYKFEDSKDNENITIHNDAETHKVQVNDLSVEINNNNNQDEAELSVEMSEIADDDTTIDVCYSQGEVDDDNSNYNGFGSQLPITHSLSSSSRSFLSVMSDSLDDCVNELANVVQQQKNNKTNSYEDQQSNGSIGEIENDNEISLDEIKSRERYYKRMKRLKRELEIQGMPGMTQPENEKVHLSPPLPLQERVFNIGDVVWGPYGDVRFWPGKLISLDDATTDSSICSDIVLENNNDKLIVRWFGANEISMVAPESLKTLTEGLEAHHCARKRHRSGKRVNVSLERAIQEAMIELDNSNIETKS